MIDLKNIVFTTTMILTYFHKRFQKRKRKKLKRNLQDRFPEYIVIMRKDKILVICRDTLCIDYEFFINDL